MVLPGEATGGKGLVAPGVAAKLGAKQTPHRGNQKFRENTVVLSRLKAGLQEEQVARSASAAPQPGSTPSLAQDGFWPGPHGTSECRTGTQRWGVRGDAAHSYRSGITKAPENKRPVVS